MRQLFRDFSQLPGVRRLFFYKPFFDSSKMEPAVFYSSAILIVTLALLAVFFTESFDHYTGIVNQWMTSTLAWYFVLVMSVFLVFVLWLLLSPYGQVRLGDDGEGPEYGFWSWFAMLFSAGMGIGLLFYGVAEPLLHYGSPPRAEPETVAAATEAFHISFFHWGFHAWAVYIVVGLTLAYFHYRKKLPLSLRSAFYPILGDRVYGWIGHTIDIVAVLGTLFGVATSLGLGVLQINAGLAELGVFNQSTPIQVALIAVITLAATISVVSGLDRGIKRLSTFNIILGGLLMLFLFLWGPMVFILNLFVQQVGYYLQHLPETMFWTDAFGDGEWVQGWTVFYWAWWISWSPFVGIFIARISRGRTIREFVAGVLFVPTAFCALWMTIFGGSAIYFERNGEMPLLATAQEDVSVALFTLLESYPIFPVMALVTVLIIASYFVTSSDSGSLVVDMIASGGRSNPLIHHRVWWAVLEGTVAATLLIGGGLTALQTAAISTAIPFSVVILLMIGTLVYSLRREKAPERGGG